MTSAELSLWHELRGNKPSPYFRMQQIIEGFVVDFYCQSAGLVIEVDGDIHRGQLEYDARRDKILESMGLLVVRYSNGDVLLNLPRVLDPLKEMLVKK
jgi:very-short-patch-repair endonuclease